MNNRLGRIALILAVYFVLPGIVYSQESSISLGHFYKKEAGADLLLAIKEALSYCKKNKLTRLEIPAGVYDFYPEHATEAYVFASNNDEGLKRIAFLLEDFENFEIDGTGASFIFHGFMSPFVLKNCENIRLHGFSTDWDRPFHSEAKIIAGEKDSLELTISRQYPYKILNQRLVFYGYKNEVYAYGGLLEFDPVKKETAYMAQDYWTNSDMLAREISPGHIKVYWKGIKATPGNTLTFAPSGRLSPAIVVSDSRDIKVSAVTLFHCGGMGMIAQRSSNITIDQVNVKPSGDRVVSITSDATHFVNCTGTITLSDCVFENQLDDATNIHGIYVRVSRKLTPTSLLLTLVHPQQSGFDFIKPGKVMELVHSKSLTGYGTAQVASVRRLNKHHTIVNFKKELPAALEVGDVLADNAVSPEVVIKNCIIRGNRARGILLGSKGKTLVENNYFHNAGAAILFEGDGSHWFEQSGVRDVAIINNVFHNCNYGVWGNAVIQVGTGIMPEWRKTSRYNRGIVIKDNMFKIFDPRVIYAYSVDTLTFENNRIERTLDYPSSFAGANPFEINDCDHVLIQSGSFSGPKVFTNKQSRSF